MKKGIIIFLSVCLVAVMGLTALFLYDSPDNKFRAFVLQTVKDIATDEGEEAELLSKIPRFDADKYNRFTFNMSIMGGNTDGDGKEFTMSGSTEVFKNIGHMYNLDVNFAKSGYQASPESWSDFSKDISYQNFGEGWATEKVKNLNSIENLAAAINTRNTEKILVDDGEVCTLSWTFPADVNYLFGEMMDDFTKDREFSGFGRITAVFDPQTHEFKYFTVVVSGSNSEQAGALLDAAFYWDVVNDGSLALKIPDDVSSSAYAAATGVISDGGYDRTVNPLAEAFIEVYGGSAEVTHDGDNAYLFWTLEQEDGISATVTYSHESDPVTRFETDYTFFKSMYGEPAEETDDGAYFFDSEKGELTYMARGEDWYAEIIITGQPGVSQGELRKPLITYKSRLKI